MASTIQIETLGAEWMMAQIGRALGVLKRSLNAQYLVGIPGYGKIFLFDYFLITYMV